MVRLGLVRFCIFVLFENFIQKFVNEKMSWNPINLAQFLVPKFSAFLHELSGVMRLVRRISVGRRQAVLEFGPFLGP